MKIIKDNVTLSQLYLKELPEILKGVHIVDGGFYIIRNNLRSLKNSPEKVDFVFDCSDNKSLTSFIEGPKEVGRVDARNSGFRTLEGFPKVIKRQGLYGLNLGNIDISGNRLTSLVGLPETVDGTLSIFGNSNLKSLEGCSKVIKVNFEAVWLPIKNMIGGPVEIEKDCYLNNTAIDSIEGFPEYIGGNLYLGDTPLWDKLYPYYPTKKNLETSRQLRQQLLSTCYIDGGIYKSRDHYEEPEGV